MRVSADIRFILHKTAASLLLCYVDHLLPGTERHLLYVACTQARDHLLVTGVAPVSEFLEDLRD